MGEAGCETVEYGVWVWGFLGASLEEEFRDDGFPVIAHEDELVFEEVNEGSLVLALSQVVPVVVEGDLGRGVFPRIVTFIVGGIFVNLI